MFLKFWAQHIIRDQDYIPKFYVTQPNTSRIEPGVETKYIYQRDNRISKDNWTIPVGLTDLKGS